MTTVDPEKPWGGRFSEVNSKAMEDFHSSLRFDKRLYLEDILGSQAHAEMLVRTNIINKVDGDKIKQGLSQIRKEIESQNFQFTNDLEDIHMAIEKRLTSLIGEAGGRLHTARSRNDQVATDTRLHLLFQIKSQSLLLKNFLSTLLELSKSHLETLLPGYTHLQPAQPIRLSFYFLAYFQMFKRDLERLQDLKKRVSVMPLGSGALAGVNYPIDREVTRDLLGFDAVGENALDGVSDRDFVIEYLSFASTFMMHVSRLAEELILWSNPNFGFVEISDLYSTGSSIMPNKKNPDALELLRGKSGRVFGHLTGMLSLMKGLPLAYNKDMQEDKEALFDTLDTINATLHLVPDILKTASWNAFKMKLACQLGYLAATDVADYLVKKGLPFREAHHVSGRLVKDLYLQQKVYEDLKVEDFKKFSPLFEEDILKVIQLETVLENKKSQGSSSLKSVMQQQKVAEKFLADLL